MHNRLQKKQNITSWAKRNSQLFQGPKLLLQYMYIQIINIDQIYLSVVCFKSVFISYTIDINLSFSFIDSYTMYIEKKNFIFFFWSQIIEIDLFYKTCVHCRILLSVYIHMYVIVHLIFQYTNTIIYKAVSLNLAMPVYH